MTASAAVMHVPCCLSVWCGWARNVADLRRSAPRRPDETIRAQMKVARRRIGRPGSDAFTLFGGSPEVDGPFDIKGWDRPGRRLPVVHQQELDTIGCI